MFNKSNTWIKFHEDHPGPGDFQRKFLQIFKEK